MLARVSHVYAQYISVIVYMYNQSCLAIVYITFWGGTLFVYCK